MWTYSENELDLTCDVVLLKRQVMKTIKTYLKPFSRYELIACNKC